MSEYDGEGRSRTRILLFVVGLLVGALVVAAVWRFTVLSSSGDSASPAAAKVRPPATAKAGAKASASPKTAPQSSPAESSSPATPSKSAGAASSDPTTSGGGNAAAAGGYVTRCQRVYDTQTPPLQAADPAMSQWEIHIGAMNKLVTGAISLRQATAFWNQTRVGAKHRLAHYDRAQQRYAQRTVHCPEPGPAHRAQPGAERCFRAVAARRHTIRLATIALRTWKLHVHHMEMLRNGQMTPSMAEQMWLRSWRTGNRQVHDFRVAARASTGATC